MAVGSNSEPLISLARIKHLHLLPDLYDEVIVPHAVHNEIIAEPDLPGAKELREAKWLRVRQASDQMAVQRLLFWLDNGESEAIILAKEMNVTLLIDERRGRTIATTMGLNFTGTIGVLLAAKTNGHVQSITPLLDSLLLTGIRISPRLYEEAQQLAGEKQPHSIETALAQMTYLNDAALWQAARSTMPAAQQARLEALHYSPS